MTVGQAAPFPALQIFTSPFEASKGLETLAGKGSSHLYSLGHREVPLGRGLAEGGRDSAWVHLQNPQSMNVFRENTLGALPVSRTGHAMAMRGNGSSQGTLDMQALGRVWSLASALVHLLPW